MTQCGQKIVLGKYNYPVSTPVDGKYNLHWNTTFQDWKSDRQSTNNCLMPTQQSFHRQTTQQ